MAEDYLSIDPNAGLEDSGYISTDPSAGLETQEPSGFVKGLQTAQQAFGVAQQGLMGLYTGAGPALNKLLFPKQHEWETRPIVSPETATGVVHAALTPLRTLEEVAFGDRGKQGAAMAEQFVGEQLAGFTSPESLALAAAGGIVGKMPKLREVAFGKPPPVEAMPQTPEPPISETVQPLTETAVPKVEEVIPNAEQIQGPARPNVDVQLPGGEVAREVYGGEMPADVGGERVPPRGQGETLQQTPQEVVAPVPQPEQPPSLATEGGEQIPLEGQPKPTEVLPQVGRPEERNAVGGETFNSKADAATKISELLETVKSSPKMMELVNRNALTPDNLYTPVKSGNKWKIVATDEHLAAAAKEKATPVSQPTETTTAQPLPKTEPPPPAAPPLVETAAEAPIQKPSKIGKSIEAKAVEAKLTEGFKDTAGYDPITIKDQAERATRFVKESPTDARAVIRGDAALPEGLRGTSLITAMEEELIRKPDAKLAYELANSQLVSETSAAAQEMRLMSERVPDSLAAKFQEIKEARKAGSKLRGETPESLFQDIRKEIVRQSSKRPTWEAFVREITC